LKEIIDSEGGVAYFDSPPMCFFEVNRMNTEEDVQYWKKNPMLNNMTSDMEHA